MIGWALRHFSGKSILRTPRMDVSVKRVNAHQTDYVVLGRIDTSGNETDASILQRIVRAFVPAQNEKSDSPISHDGKEPIVGAISYDMDNLPTLSEADQAHLVEIKKRAAVRRAKRLAEAGQDGTPSTSRRGAIVPIKSSRGKLIKISK